MAVVAQPVTVDTVLDKNGNTTSTGPGTAAPAPGTLEALLGDLTGPNRDAAAAVISLFTNYGLSGLAPDIINFVKNGYSGDTIALLLQQTDAYKQRFAGNTARLANGLPVLSPAEYLATEDSYRQIMSSAGLPVGFWDNPQDFADLISRDVSPTELQGRVQVASQLVNNNDPQTLAYYRQHYTTGDLVAYALDPSRAEPLIEQQYKAAQIGGAASVNGINVDQNTAEQLAAQGVGLQQASAGFGQVAADVRTAGQLGAIYGSDYSQQDAISEVFNNSDQATQKRRSLVGLEKANFGGTSAVGAQSLGSADAGAY